MILPLRVFGSSCVNVMYFGRVNLPSFFATCSRSSSASSGVPAIPGFQRDERVDRLTRHVVDLAADRRFGDVRMIDERALDFGVEMRWPLTFITSSMRPMNQIVAVLVAIAAVAGQELAGELRPVRLLVAFVVAPDAAHHRRPRPREHDVTAAAERNRVRPPRRRCRPDAGERLRRRTRLERRDAGQRRDHDPAGFRLPPRVARPARYRRRCIRGTRSTLRD